MQTALGTCRRRGAAPPGAARHTHNIHLALNKRMPARTHGGRFAEGGRHTSARMHGRASPAAMCAGRSSSSAITPAARSGACRNRRISGACRTTGACRSRHCDKMGSGCAPAAWCIAHGRAWKKRSASVPVPQNPSLGCIHRFYTRTRSHAHTFAHANRDTDARTHTHTHIHIHTHAHTHKHTRARACTRTHAHRHLRRTRHRRDEREVAQRPAGEHSAQPDVVSPRATASPCHRNWLRRRRRASPA